MTASAASQLLVTLYCVSYIQWHNLAYKTIQQFNISSIVIYYEDYTTRFNQTLKKLTNFLELPMVNPPKPFIAGKTYENFFDRESIENAAYMTRYAAIPETWELVRHYFERGDDEGAEDEDVEDDDDEEEEDVEDEDVEEDDEEEDVEDEDVEDAGGDSESDAPAIIVGIDAVERLTTDGSKDIPQLTEVALLMSFPNSVSAWFYDRAEH